ncbi:hypothetical protein ADL00_25445 [Streptomyces sp. AS58]|uniref:hypothetical protein n=1 Tax=Streptomyces sp. AS58 TaxID=1519489 RepID=UPI0006AF8B2B|nr:hypothetical protein [Streptomyces sp. AS58]KOV59955.1 hypothetical protein ADL00_25445 [Streptomyces sp. AS58]
MIDAPDSLDHRETPQDYNLVIPDGWFKVSLDPEDRDRSISALAEQQFLGVDHAPHLKERVARQLQKTAKDAYRTGGMELYLSTLRVGSLPLSSALLISLPMPGAMPRSSTVHDVADLLQQRGADVTVTQLPFAGTAVRELKTESGIPSIQLGNELSTTKATYYVQVPASDEWLVMTFSTPLDPLAEQMVGLFDAVARTLHWS